ncbi:undecaprenyldiphospho-muramoylpentapeptide beta-N-acetylglucosaminyltransferase [Megalodesulfovibrio gigas]|uniref:UDP-N-acetylglucosamine--N-acetylmuramyl-(pentapeptide) pyrophosphoryl-undecaprenol N-acetylglucosamine transferase n=1 Tax=Megalodesulfovibrio gigas (strain ATCC 19364 / DSM 1382 / NCIMB 9332 / VKM B-1759) TaxID=1121448 RepID=T2G7K3_MEGG1|nr:undecaprenyldiphospho-muramoylpentapeptide beta-N-acetylglucosaminyltransferase [Megalodesulfovibrio gigas]AGW12268.1 putative UDP-N-acetylglucosamine--N-acetylmuramyl-(pentapeptide) pyrophosphoryl-undecaprenol N-acetylglucosamine transferase [Megalodesulfovibrio gigas DSM 1382 = ATCC 19364]
MALERLILTTGGTGGHIFPALAVAEALRRNRPQARVLFVGGKSGPEGRLCQRAGIEFLALPVRGVVGRGLRAVGAMAALASAFVQAVRLVRSFRPQVVAGFGGYASFPAMAAAAVLGVPTVLHEQNSVPGVSNRLLGRLARAVLLSFPDALQRFPAATATLTGNPVRQNIAALQALPRANSGERRLLVLGGSQGAVAVNDAVIAALPRFKAAGMAILHQAGERDADRVRAAYIAAGWPADCVHAFIDDMAAAYAWADLAVCRAGASTVFELAAAGLPAVCIPFPFATHNHQAVNARHLEQAGAALCLEQQELSRRDLAGEIIALLDNPERLAAMGQAARAWARPEAAADIAAVLDRLAAPARKTA